MRDLLRAHPRDGPDSESIERTVANVIGPELLQRLADSTWRLTLQDGESVYLLLECQSEPDPTKPLRMLHAVATLCLSLSRNPPAGHTATRLPSVRQLTVYSGRQGWTISAMNLQRVFAANFRLGEGIAYGLDKYEHPRR